MSSQHINGLPTHILPTDPNSVLQLKTSYKPIANSLHHETSTFTSTISRHARIHIFPLEISTAFNDVPIRYTYSLPTHFPDEHEGDTAGNLKQQQRTNAYEPYHQISNKKSSRQMYGPQAHLRGVGFIEWYSTPSPNLSPYIFLGLDPSPPPLVPKHIFPSKTKREGTEGSSRQQERWGAGVEYHFQEI